MKMISRCGYQYAARVQETENFCSLVLEGGPDAMDAAGELCVGKFSNQQSAEEE